MNIKGPITITIEGPQGSGKTQLSNLIKQGLYWNNIEWIEIQENTPKGGFNDLGQVITIIEKQSNATI